MKRVIFQNIAKSYFNETSILNNFKSLMDQVYEKGYTRKINKKKDQNFFSKQI